MARAACVMLLAGPIWVMAGEQAHTLTVGFSEQDYPPFYYEEDGEMAGPAIEILESITEELGFEVTYERHPWSRIQRYLETGDIDMVSLYMYSPERAEHVRYTDIPHLYERSAIVVAADSDVSAEGGQLESLAGYRVGAVRGYLHGKPFADIREQLDIVEVTEEAQLVEMLVGGHIDAIVGVDATIVEYARRLGVADDIEVLEPGVDISADYFAFSRRSEDVDAEQLARSFSVELSLLKREDEYRELLEAHSLRVSPQNYGPIAVEYGD